MKIFNPYEVTYCKKCGCREAKDEFIRKSILGNSGYDLDVIERTCLNCGYVWDELPLDAEDE